MRVLSEHCGDEAFALRVSKLDAAAGALRRHHDLFAPAPLESGKGKGRCGLVALATWR